MILFVQPQIYQMSSSSPAKNHSTDKRQVSVASVNAGGGEIRCASISLKSTSEFNFCQRQTQRTSQVFQQSVARQASRTPIQLKQVGSVVAESQPVEDPSHNSSISGGGQDPTTKRNRDWLAAASSRRSQQQKFMMTESGLRIQKHDSILGEQKIQYRQGSQSGREKDKEVNLPRESKLYKAIVSQLARQKRQQVMDEAARCNKYTMRHAITSHSPMSIQYIEKQQLVQSMDRVPRFDEQGSEQSPNSTRRHRIFVLKDPTRISAASPQPQSAAHEHILSPGQFQRKKQKRNQNVTRTSTEMQQTKFPAIVSTKDIIRQANRNQRERVKQANKRMMQHDSEQISQEKTEEKLQENLMSAESSNSVNNRFVSPSQLYKRKMPLPGKIVSDFGLLNFGLSPNAGQLSASKITAENLSLSKNTSRKAIKYQQQQLAIHLKQVKAEQNNEDDLQIRQLASANGQSNKRQPPQKTIEIPKDITENQIIGFCTDQINPHDIIPISPKSYKKYEKVRTKQNNSPLLMNLQTPQDKKKMQNPNSLCQPLPTSTASLLKKNDPMLDGLLHFTHLKKQAANAVTKIDLTSMDHVNSIMKKSTDVKMLDSVEIEPYVRHRQQNDPDNKYEVDVYVEWQSKKMHDFGPLKIQRCFNNSTQDRAPGGLIQGKHVYNHINEKDGKMMLNSRSVMQSQPLHFAQLPSGRTSDNQKSGHKKTNVSYPPPLRFDSAKDCVTNGRGSAEQYYRDEPLTEEDKESFDQSIYKMEIDMNRDCTQPLGDTTPLETEPPLVARNSQLLTNNQSNATFLADSPQQMKLANEQNYPTLSNHNFVTTNPGKIMIQVTSKKPEFIVNNTTTPIPELMIDSRNLDQIRMPIKGGGSKADHRLTKQSEQPWSTCSRSEERQNYKSDPQSDPEDDRTLPPSPLKPVIQFHNVQGGTSHQLLCDEITSQGGHLSFAHQGLNTNEKHRKQKPQEHSEKKKLGNMPQTQVSWSPICMKYPSTQQMMLEKGGRQCLSQSPGKHQKNQQITVQKLKQMMKQDKSSNKQLYLSPIDQSDKSGYSEVGDTIQTFDSEANEFKADQLDQSASKQSLGGMIGTNASLTIKSSNRNFLDDSSKLRNSPLIPLTMQNHPAPTVTSPAPFKYGTQAARKTTLRQVRKYFAGMSQTGSAMKRIQNSVQQQQQSLLLTGQNPHASSKNENTVLMSIVNSNHNQSATHFNQQMMTGVSQMPHPQHIVTAMENIAGQNMLSLTLTASNSIQERSEDRDTVAFGGSVSSRPTLQGNTNTTRPFGQPGVLGKSLGRLRKSPSPPNVKVFVNNKIMPIENVQAFGVQGTAASPHVGVLSGRAFLRYNSPLAQRQPPRKIRVQNVNLLSSRQK